MQFASRAKLVTTHATVNEVLDDSVKLKRMSKEVSVLKEKLAFFENSANSISSSANEMALLKKISEMDATIETLTNDIKSAESELNEVNGNYENKESELSALRAELESMKSEFEGLLNLKAEENSLLIT